MKTVISLVKALALVLSVASPLAAAPSVTGPYQLTVFASGTTAYNSPDSITVDGSGNVWVSYTNGVAPDGSDGKTSTVVEYSSTGTVLNTYTIQGSNDGLGYNPADGTIWANRNQDSNAAVTIISPRTNTTTDYTFSSAPLHQGGYDDVVFLDGKIYLSASNPTLDANGFNTAPSIVSATVSGTTIQTSPVLAGDVTARDVVTKKPVRTIQTDPDSMRADPNGNLVLDSQADSILLFVSNPGTAAQSVVEVPLTDSTGAPVMVDDTSFPTTPTGTLLFTDSKTNNVYALTGNAFVPGLAYSNTGSGVGTIREKTGVFTPIVSGLGSSHGSIFIPGTGSAQRVFFAFPSVGGSSTSIPENGRALKVQVTRTGNDLSQPLTVNYQTVGSARAGVNYKALSGSVTFPAGSSSAKIKVRPLDDGIVNGGQILKIKLTPGGSSYGLGVPAIAKVRIRNTN